MDESSKQTEAVQKHLARSAAGDGTSTTRKDRSLAKHRGLQLLLSGALVVQIPFANQLRLPANRVAVRRSFGHLLSVIKAVAFLRQQQRRIVTQDGQKVVIATIGDYGVAVDLLLPILTQSFSPLGAKSQALLTEIDQRAEAMPCTRDDLSDWLGVSYRESVRRLKPLIGAGLISQDSSTKPYRLSRSNTPAPTARDLGLPSEAELAALCSQTADGSQPPVNAEVSDVAADTETAADGTLCGKRQDPRRIVNPLADKDLATKGRNPGKAYTEELSKPTSKRPRKPNPTASHMLGQVYKAPDTTHAGDPIHATGDPIDVPEQDLTQPEPVDPALPAAERAAKYRLLATASEALLPELAQQYRDTADEIERGETPK